MKELKIEEKVIQKPTTLPIEKVLEREDIEIDEEVAPEIEEEDRPRTLRPRSEVEEKLEQLRNEVLRELEELEKLELEA